MLKYMAAIATAAAMAPATLGATPAVAGEALDAAVTVPDRSPAEDSTNDVTDLSEDAAGNAEPLVGRAAKSATERGVPVPDEPTAKPATEEEPSNLETADVTPGIGGKSDLSRGRSDRRPVLQIIDKQFKVEAGGKWAEFTTTLDNSEGNRGDETAYNFTVRISPTTGTEGELREGDFEVQYFRNGTWHDAELTYRPDGSGKLEVTFADNSLPVELITHRFRFRVSKSTSVSSADIFNLVTYIDRETGKAIAQDSRAFQTDIAPLSGEDLSLIH
ncbi:hypothetical protein, partial [Streptomyces katrae]